MERKNLTPLTIAAVYVGTVVGAGFASGQEVLQFFAFFGLKSVPALLLAGFLFIFFGRIILGLGYQLQAKTYSSIVRYAVGRFLGGVVEGIITFFLFGALTAMAAGAGAIFAEQFGLPKAAGSISMIITSLLTVLLGFHGVVMAISFVVPVLLISVLGLSAATLANTPIDFEAVKLWATAAKPAIPLWPVSALAYVSYNIILSLCILAPLGSRAASTAVTAKGALWGGLGLFLGALAINFAILTFPSRAARLEIPMVYIAGQFSPLVQAGYALVLLAEIYTTAVANLYGFTARLAPSETPRFKQTAAATAVAAFIASLLGFSALVRYLYSTVGIAGFLFLGGLTYRFLQKEFTRV